MQTNTEPKKIDWSPILKAFGNSATQTSREEQETFIIWNGPMRKQTLLKIRKQFGQNKVHLFRNQLLWFIPKL